VMTANRAMYVNGTKYAWWQRSPGESTSCYCEITTTASGDGSSVSPSSTCALVPFGCV
jgi:hypothetical protein